MNKYYWIIPVVAIIAYLFLMIRSSSKRVKEDRDRFRQFQDSLKNGQRIITTGGIHGTIKRLGEKTVDLEVAKGVTIVLERYSIRSIIQEEE